MKKSTLYTGLVYVLIGVISLLIAITTEFRLEGLLWGIAGAGICPGFVMIRNYFYWTKPEHKNDYDNRLKNEEIDLKDERKIMLRDKSGRMAYIAMLGLQCGLMLCFSILSILGYFNPFSKYACVGLGLLVIIQYILGVVVYRRLSKNM
ncbi:MAG: hypothetical protein ACTIOK_02300 [Enterococcus malodoratus]